MKKRKLREKAWNNRSSPFFAVIFTSSISLCGWKSWKIYKFRFVYKLMWMKKRVARGCFCNGNWTLDSPFGSMVTFTGENWPSRVKVEIWNILQVPKAYVDEKHVTSSRIEQEWFCNGNWTRESPFGSKWTSMGEYWQSLKSLCGRKQKTGLKGRRAEIKALLPFFYVKVADSRPKTLPSSQPASRAAKNRCRNKVA